MSEELKKPKHIERQSCGTLWFGYGGGCMEWQPIETAPKDGTEILGYLKDGRRVAVRYSGCKFSKWTMPGVCGLEPSHWMELPKKPTDT